VRLRLVADCARLTVLTRVRLGHLLGVLGARPRHADQLPGADALAVGKLDLTAEHVGEDDAEEQRHKRCRDHDHGAVPLRDQGDPRGDQDHREQAAKQVLSALEGEAAADQDARDRTDQDVAGEAEIDVPGHPVGDARRPEQDRGMEDVRADDPLRRQPEDGDQDDRDQRPRPGRGHADHEPGRDPGCDRGNDVAPVEMEREALLDHVGDEDRPQGRRDADDQQGRTEDPEDDAVELVLADAVLEVFDDGDAADRSRDAAGGHPERQALVHGAGPEMLDAAHRLRHRRVEDVGADRRHRLDPEDQDQKRRHQRRTAHAGHPDQQADAKSECDDRGIHDEVEAASGTARGGGSGGGSTAFSTGSVQN
jgi:hypothetical protein